MFDEESLEFLIKTHPPFIKIAYSKKNEAGWIKRIFQEEIEPIVSCDIMSIDDVSAVATRLYCIPKYPIPYMICFDNLFPRFHGFSDHSLGFDQTLEAIYAGAKIIEKHVTLIKPDIFCPDSRFALPINEFISMTQCVRQIEKGIPV